MQQKIPGLRLVLLLASVCSLGLHAWAVPVTLIADAHVNAARPTVNSGGISNINVGGGYTGLIQFDLSVLPAGTTSTQIARAILRLYCNRLDSPGMVNLAALNAAWSEFGVNYATLPAVSGSSQTFAVSQAGAYVAVDVTALVQGWVANPASNQGLELSSGSAVLQFDSKENDLTAHPAALDIQLAGQGIAGAPGPVGATGPAGPAGLPGAAGPQGPIGSPGLTGAAGPQGPAGLPGAQGPAGQQGTPGAEGVAGAAGMPGAPGPTGAAGPAGQQGPSGSQGAIGLTGPAGLQGPAGAAGPPVSFRGIWNQATSYAPGDAVGFSGSSYAALLPNTNSQPDQSPLEWSLLAAAGATGPAGAQGSAGAQGLPGAPGASGPAGPQGAQGPSGATGPPGLTGQAGAAGPAGPVGPQGAAGAPGLNFRAAWVQGFGYAPNDAVTYAGSTWIAVAANASVTPGSDPGSWTMLAAAGAMGPSGATGAAATVLVGSVTTGAPGSAATVTNSGTGTAAVLNFAIPQGATGAPGSGGSGGGSTTSGIPYASMYHSVSYTTTYYSLNNPNQDAHELADVLTWIPNGCSATRLDVFSEQGNTILVTLRVGASPATMANTAMACLAAQGQSCTATVPVTVPPGSFVDFEIDKANVSPAGVWTAVLCN